MSIAARTATRARRTRLHPQFLTDDKGRRKSVFLPAREFEALIDELEDLRDTVEADWILADTKPEDWIPLEQVKKELGL